MQKIHNKQLSIAKGIGISLMVIGHSHCPVFLHDFIYSFHMILFYFCSAYFFKDEAFIFDKKKFYFKKVKGLYWPYVKWSIIFILLHNLFYKIGFNADKLSLIEIYINIKRSIRFLWQGEHFLGTYWFLPSLFWEIILFSIVVFVCKSQKVRGIIIVVLFCIGLGANCKGIGIYVSRELVILPVFYWGYLWGNHILPSEKLLEQYVYKKIIIFLLLAFLIVIVACNDPIEIGANLFGIIPLSFCGFICGILFIYSISKNIMNAKLGGYLDVVGKYTLEIMTFHFLGFKLLSWLLLNIYNDSYSKLAEWPVPDSYAKYWYLYSVMGVAFPLLLCFIKKKVFLFCKKNGKV